MRKIIDMTGEMYGSLTVLRMAGKNASNTALWLCRCACGHPECKGEVVIRGEILRSCCRTSCGAGRVKGAGLFATTR